MMMMFSCCHYLWLFMRLVVWIVVGYLMAEMVHHLPLLSNECFAAHDNASTTVGQVVLSPPEKQLVLIGIMTTKTFLKTRAKAVYDTWGKDVVGRVIFFTSENSEADEDLPIVRLPDVDDSYPPQKKSFMMLKYMHDHYLNDFEFFMRVDDDIHIRNDQLMSFLTVIYHSGPLLIGQPGVGTKEERGTLGLDINERFCMGGPGIIFNREVLIAIRSHINSCMASFLTWHEDVELWRCIKRHARVDCTSNTMWKEYFYHHVEFEDKIVKGLLYKDILSTISLHPIKNPNHHFTLYSYLEGLKITQMETNLVQTIEEIDKLTATETVSLTDPTGGYFYDLPDPAISYARNFFNYHNGTNYFYSNDSVNNNRESFITIMMQNIAGIVSNTIHKPSGRRVASMRDRNVPGILAQYYFDVKYSVEKRLPGTRLKEVVKSRSFSKINIKYGLLWIREISGKFVIT